MEKKASFSLRGQLPSLHCQQNRNSLGRGSTFKFAALYISTMIQVKSGRHAEPQPHSLSGIHVLIIWMTLGLHWSNYQLITYVMTLGISQPVPPGSWKPDWGGKGIKTEIRSPEKLWSDGLCATPVCLLCIAHGKLVLAAGFHRITVSTPRRRKLQLLAFAHTGQLLVFTGTWTRRRPCRFPMGWSPWFFTRPTHV